MNERETGVTGKLHETEVKSTQKFKDWMVVRPALMNGLELVPQKGRRLN